jgi:hypothetical protein
MYGVLYLTYVTGDVGACLVLRPGIGVVLVVVFFIVVGCVSSVPYPVFVMLHFH